MADDNSTFVMKQGSLHGMQILYAQSIFTSKIQVCEMLEVCQKLEDCQRLEVKTLFFSCFFLSGTFLPCVA